MPFPKMKSKKGNPFQAAKKQSGKKNPVASNKKQSVKGKGY